jgi:SSS family solute:Na+ symporter
MGLQRLQTLDLHYFLRLFLYCSGYGYWIYNRKKSKEASTQTSFWQKLSYWWAIGASLIASNISAEQFIGMSGSGFKMGLAISTYEWMAAATLMIVAIFFMPIYLKNRIFTMPQFLTQRYNETVSMIMAIFWLLLYVIVNLTSILYLGALAVSTISGLNFWMCMISLAVFAIIITLGGMKVIGYTDVIQVFFLIMGGLATTYLALNLVSEHFGESGVVTGFNYMMRKAPEHFHMVFNESNPSYMDLPGLTILIGGMWIVNLNYWGCNQYITQRALGADLPTARNGILFAAFLKLLMPVIVVFPGIAAMVLHQEGMFQTEMLTGGELNPDNAYPVLLNLLPVGLKGLSFAALTAAIVASLAGKANSISTIFTLDIYKKYINTEASEQKQVRIGRLTVMVAMIVAVAISDSLGIDKKGGFQFIQEYTGFVSPGIFAVFLLGFFWKKANSNGALAAIIGGFLLSVILKFLPAWGVDLSFLSNAGFAVINQESGLYEIPFLDRMGFVFIFCVLMIMLLADRQNSPKGLEIDSSMFRPHPGFTVGALIILGVLVALYTIFW